MLVLSWVKDISYSTWSCNTYFQNQAHLCLKSHQKVFSAVPHTTFVYDVYWFIHVTSNMSSVHVVDNKCPGTNILTFVAKLIFSLSKQPQMNVTTQIVKIKAFDVATENGHYSVQSGWMKVGCEICSVISKARKRLGKINRYVTNPVRQLSNFWISRSVLSIELTLDIAAIYYAWIQKTSNCRHHYFLFSYLLSPF